MEKLPYGSITRIAHKCEVSEQYVNTVLRDHHNGEHMMYTDTQKAIIRAYKRIVKKNIKNSKHDTNNKA